MGIYWLASYPKSGNTWLRVLLSNYDHDGKEAVPLDRLTVPSALSQRYSMDMLLGLPSADLRPDEIEEYYPKVCWQFAEDAGANRLFVKMHSACIRDGAGRLLFPPGAAAGVVYVVRNPLDVAASFAPFLGWTIDRTIAAMADENLVLDNRPGGIGSYLPQRLGSWSTHVTSWLDAPGYRLHVVRYEDLLDDTAGMLGDLLRFAGTPPKAARVRRAVSYGRFDRLQREEAEQGFCEGSPVATAPFFRRGRAGSWREELTVAQALRIVADHGAVMRRLGYDTTISQAASRDASVIR